MHKIFADPMDIIPKVRNTHTHKMTKVSRKQFGTKGVGLRVKRREGLLRFLKCILKIF